MCVPRLQYFVVVFFQRSCSTFSFYFLSIASTVMLTCAPLSTCPPPPPCPFCLVQIGWWWFGADAAQKLQPERPLGTGYAAHPGRGRRNVRGRHGHRHGWPPAARTALQECPVLLRRAPRRNVLPRGGVGWDTTPQRTTTV